MPEEQGPFLELDLGDQGPVRFEDFEEAWTWYQKQRSFLQGLLHGRRDSNASNAGNLLGPQFQQVDKLFNEVRQHLDSDRYGSFLPGLKQHLTKLFGGAAVDGSAKGQFLKGLGDDDPDQAVAALCLLLGAPLQPQASSFRGAVELALFEKGLPETYEAKRRAIDAVIRDGKRQVAALKGQHTKLTKVSQSLEEEKERLLAGAQQEVEKLLEAGRSQIEEVAQEFRSKLEQHEKTYAEKLALHEAVEYWEKRERKRRGQATRAAITFCAGLLAAAFFLSFFVDQLLVGDLTPQKVFGVLLAASPIFWGLRVLARLLLSRLHLSTDASERAILIQTYLALHKEGKIRDEDRELLLAAVFRPSSTGLLKEDAASEWSEMVAAATKR